MKPRIKYELKAYGRTVVFYVHDMDERVHKSDLSVFFCENGLAVTITNHNKTNKLVIYLSNFKPDYGTSSFLIFDTVEEASEHVSKAHEAITDWANNWEGWGDNKEPEVELLKEKSFNNRGCGSCCFVYPKCGKPKSCDGGHLGYYGVRSNKRTLTEDNGVFTI